MLPLQFTNAATTIKPSIKVMPNPTKQFLQINLPYKSNWHITLNKSNGVLVKELVNEQMIYFLDVQEYATGIYHLQIIDSEQKRYTQKIVVMP